jgi:DNA-directed RNA polymerase specialized sigma24 family protein
MKRKADFSNHPDPEGIASEYVIRLMEGYHQRATVDQAYIDICRLTVGRKGQPGYEGKKRLNMLALTAEQNDHADLQPSTSNLTADQRLDLAKALGCIKNRRTRDIFDKVLKGWTYQDIADDLGLTLARIQQIVTREIVSIRGELA